MPLREPYIGLPTPRESLPGTPMPPDVGASTASRVDVLTPEGAAKQAVAQGATQAQAVGVAQVVSAVLAGRALTPTHEIERFVPGPILANLRRLQAGLPVVRLAQPQYRLAGPVVHRAVSAPAVSLADVTKALAQVSDDLYNAAIIQQAAVMAAMKQADYSQSVAPNTPVQIYANKQSRPVVVYVQAQNTGKTVSGLYLANTSGGAALGSASIADYNGAGASALVLPQQALYAAIDTSDGTSAYIVATVIALRGRSGIFGA